MSETGNDAEPMFFGGWGVQMMLAEGMLALGRPLTRLSGAAAHGEVAWMSVLGVLSTHCI